MWLIQVPGPELRLWHCTPYRETKEFKEMGTIGNAVHLLIGFLDNEGTNQREDSVKSIETETWKFLLHFREMLSVKINTGNYKHDQNRETYPSVGF